MKCRRSRNRINSNIIIKYATRSSIDDEDVGGDQDRCDTLRVEFIMIKNSSPNALYIGCHLNFFMGLVYLLAPSKRLAPAASCFLAFTTCR